jgi:hypothetical protein
MYWITAEFRQGGLVVNQVDHPIVITSSSTALQLKVSASSATKHIECMAIPRSWSLIRRGWPLRARKSSMPALTFRTAPNLDLISMQGEKKSSRARCVTIPLAMCLTLPPNTAIDRCEDEILQGGLSGVKVTAKWYTRKVFATRSLSLPFADGQSRDHISRNTVVEQKAVLSFPPLYLDRDPGSRAPTDSAVRPFVYSATESLQLLLPETIRSPSVHTDLLRISYELELFISFKSLGQNSLKLGPCTACMKVPLAIQLA